MSELILFGAGASYGSKNRDVPPLGDELFLALQQFNPDGWGSLSPSLAGKFRGDFEKGRNLGIPGTVYLFILLFFGPGFCRQRIRAGGAFVLKRKLSSPEGLQVRS